jgi:hypothetical protein
VAGVCNRSRTSEAIASTDPLGGVELSKKTGDAPRPRMWLLIEPVVFRLLVAVKIPKLPA